MAISNPLNIFSGDVIVVGLMKPRPRPRKRWGKVIVRSLTRLKFRRRRTRAKRWVNSPIKYWRFFTIWGKVLSVMGSGNNLRVRLCAKRRKQLVISTVFLLAKNVVNCFLVRRLQKSAGRNRLVEVVVKRKLKSKRVFPLRRVHRKFKKVK